MGEIRNVVPGEIYRHFKGKMYQIVTVATHSETCEKLVVYQRLYDDFSVYARPYDMFLSEVDKAKYPEAKQKYRFEKVNVESLISTDEVQKVPAQTAEEKYVMSDNTYEQTVKMEQPDNDLMEETDEDEGVCNPDLLAFLDADTYEEKRQVLLSAKKRVDDRLIDDIAAAMDVMVEDGDIDTRFRSLLNCIDMMMKYECTRLR